MVPVAVSAEAMPFEKKLARLGLHSRIEKEAPQSPPISATGANELAGAEIYKQNCGVCHGFPKQEMTAIAQGMYPTPPHLFRGKGVTDDPPGETYWKVANGIRLTGMPGFKNSLTDTQMWQVSLMLANTDKLPPDVMQTLTVGSGPSVPAAAPAAPAR
jgi:mono/diheme cytochrome c family protein